MMLLAALLSSVMGLVLGLLGGGGSILAVPLFLYVVGTGAKEAIATSLLVVGATSVFSALQHRRAGHVDLKVGMVFGAVAMTGAYLGGFLARYLSGTTLLLLFSAMMVAAGGAMLRQRRTEVDQGQPQKTFPVAVIALEAFGVGLITGLVGAGGGFLVVPALVLFARMPMRDAIGTSTVVIAMNSFAGFAGHVSQVSVDYGMALYVIAFAIAGAFVGTKLVGRIAPDKLRRGFGVLVLVMAVFLTVKQLPPSLVAGLGPHLWIYAVGVVVVVGGLFGAWVAGKKIAGVPPA